MCMRVLLCGGHGRRCAPWLAALVGITLATCAAEDDQDEILPALTPPPAVAHCLAGLALPADPDATTIELPDSLSETGCFTDVATLAPAPDLVPYLVRAPLWTDGVYKRRYLVLPPGQTVGFSETGTWSFPAGAILIKLFILETRRGDPETRRLLEARFMIRTGEGWHFASYAWDDSRGDAYLSSGRRTETFEVEDGSETKIIRYYFPDRTGCLQCHAEVTGQVLGPTTLQMNRSVQYEDGRRNQLAALQAAKILDGMTADPAELPAMVDPAERDAPLEARARSYLHANCSHCHQPGGWTSPGVRLDLRYDVPFAGSNTCGEPIHLVVYESLGKLVIDPGHPERSNLLQRMRDQGPATMPPTGKSLVDPLGTEVVRAWIAKLRNCP